MRPRKINDSTFIEYMNNPVNQKKELVEIAQDFNVTKPTIVSMKKKHGFTRPTKPRKLKSSQSTVTEPSVSKVERAFHHITDARGQLGKSTKMVEHHLDKAIALLLMELSIKFLTGKQADICLNALDQYIAEPTTN